MRDGASPMTPRPTTELSETDALTARMIAANGVSLTPLPTLTEPPSVTAWTIFSRYPGMPWVQVYKTIDGMLPYFATKAAATRYMRGHINTRKFRCKVDRVKVVVTREETP